MDLELIDRFALLKEAEKQLLKETKELDQLKKEVLAVFDELDGEGVKVLFTNDSEIKLTKRVTKTLDMQKAEAMFLEKGLAKSIITMNLKEGVKQSDIPKYLLSHVDKFFDIGNIVKVSEADIKSALTDGEISKEEYVAVCTTKVSNVLTSKTTLELELDLSVFVLLEDAKINLI